MGSFRELMNAKQEVEATSVCQHCAKTIELRGSIWYATGEGVASDLCTKTPRGEHKPGKVATAAKAKAQLDREIKNALAERKREAKRDAHKNWSLGSCDECGDTSVPVRFIDDRSRTANVCGVCVPAVKAPA